MATNVLVDGSLALADQENSLNGAEQSVSAKTTSYSAQNGSTQNQATLENVPLTDIIKQLYLQAVDNGGNTSAVILQNQQQGRALVFQGPAYVGGSQKTVLGFR